MLAYHSESVILERKGCPMPLWRSSVGFEKPPVVEAWIEFRFALTQEDSRWDEDTARRLVKHCFEDFIPDRLLQSIDVDINIAPGQSNPTTTPRVSFERVRAHSPDGSHCVQVGRDALVFNQLAKGKWLGYGCMRDAAMVAAEKYMGFRGFDDLATVSLHYLDVVAIPRTTDSGIELPDWLRVYPHVPSDSFGAVSAFKLTLQLPSMCENALAILRIQSVPCAGEDDTVARFAVDWHVSSTVRISTLDDAGRWLDSVHGTLENSFKRAFTAGCLGLFNPEEGE